MIVKKPSIFIYTHLADEAILREVCAGVEEEGVFYEITEFPDECMESFPIKRHGIPCWDPESGFLERPSV